MTGPEHYREAERLIKVVSDNPGIEVGTDRVLAAAQVHATLALTAATAMGLRSKGGGAHPSYSEPAGMHPEDSKAWDAVAGVQT